MLASWKKRIALLLMLVYTSQSIAALLTSCQMDASSSESRPAAASVHEVAHDMHHSMGHDHAAMGHSMHHAESVAVTSADKDTSKANTDKPDCCDMLGHCLMGNCVVIHGISSASAFSLGDGITVADLYKLSQPILLTSSHFRPPIFS